MAPCLTRLGAALFKGRDKYINKNMSEQEAKQILSYNYSKRDLEYWEKEGLSYVDILKTILEYD